MIRNLFTISILGIIIIAFSCDGGNSTIEVNCAECYVNEPDSFDLVIELTINNVYDSVYLECFEGNVESGRRIWVEWVKDPLIYLFAPVDEFYSIKANYVKDENTIIAIDGDKMVSRFIVDACDVDCWIVKGGYLDVRLKY